MSTQPPANLNEEGLSCWKKYGSNSMLMSRHFVSFDAWIEYKEDQESSWVKSRLLEGVENLDAIDPKLFRNLCKILSGIEEELEDIARRFR